MPRIPAFFRLPKRRRAMAVEALLRLLRAAFLIRLVPYRYWSGRLGIRGAMERDTAPIDQTALRDIRWAVRRVDTALGGRFTCLMQAMAGSEMMLRRGYSAEIVLGVATSRAEGPGMSLAAHAWLRAGDTVLLGGEKKEGFQEVARYRAVP